MKKFNTQAPTSTHFNRFTYAVLALMLVVMAGCSGLRLAYNNGDTVLYWWLNAYVDLDRDQKGWVRDDIDKLFDWHRKTQLKDYVDILRTGQKQLQGNITQADLMADYSEIKQRTQALLLKAAPELADLARSLKPEQIAQMEKKFKSNNDDYHEGIGGQPDARRRAIDDLEYQRLRPAVGRKGALDGDDGRGVGGKRRWRHAAGQAQRKGKYKILHRVHFLDSIIGGGRTKSQPASRLIACATIRVRLRIVATQ